MILKGKWAEVIRDFHDSRLPDAIERDIDIPLEMPIQRSVSIIGPRRAGKTYGMFQLIGKLLKSVKKEKILYVNLERADLGTVSYEDLVVMLETFYEVYPKNTKGKVWLFLDEIQNVPSWEKFVRYALDKNIRVFLSGSSSRLLSKEVATSMRGRNLSYVLLPFSFKEYLRANKTSFGKFFSSSEKAKIVHLLREYMEYGGYPEAVLYQKERERILGEIIETTIYRDVIERSKIRNIKAMKLLVNALVNSREFSVNKFYNLLKSTGVKIGKNVLYSYIQSLNDAFVVFMLRKFSYSYKHAEQSVPKAYFVDNGLLRISGIKDNGRMMENLVFVELLKRGLDISYYKAPTKEEVDFVIKDGGQVKQLIQVCYSVDDSVTKERETVALVKACRNLRCKNLSILTWDYEAEEKIKGYKIRFTPLWKWLLDVA